MKKPSILHRPMFNKGGSSAYGRGIASNLVSEEQRQRYNYGGRVGFQPNNLNRVVGWEPDYERSQIQNWYNPEYFKSKFMREEVNPAVEAIENMELYGGGDSPYQDIESSILHAPTKKQLAKEKYFRDPQNVEEYFEKVYLPAQQTEFAEEISAQKKLDPSKFQTGEGANDPEAITTESLLAGAASPQKTLTAKEDPESDVLGLTPEERKALGSSMWFNMAAAGAGSKGKTVGEVLKDTLAGGAATTGKMLDPTTRIALRTKYDKAGEQARLTDKAKYERENTEEAIIKEYSKKSGLSEEVVWKQRNTIPDISSKDKKKGEKMTDDKKGVLASGKPYFDVADGVYVLRDKKGNEFKEPDYNKVKELIRLDLIIK